MQIEITADADALATRAANLICDAVRAKPDAALGLPTGNTPVLTYAEISRRVAGGAISFERAVIYAIDEFAGAGRSTPGTNSVFYRTYVNFGQRALHCPNPAAHDPEVHIRAFADALRRAGGLHLCVLGIGENGHIAFNEPGSGRDSRAQVVELTPASRAAHAAAFGSIEAVPARGMTLGVADLLEARAIVVLAAGRPKAAIVARAITGERTADVPASWLQAHPNVTWLIDEDAASALPHQS
jgi:glucosamine-6-phosphate deaminase